jgi:hypothetical protein
LNLVDKNSVLRKKESLFLTEPITGIVDRYPPVVAVGLPRSGSSFLSDIISQLDDWYMFDDLYLYREAKSIGAVDGDLTKEELDKLIFFLGWQIRARIKFGIYSVPDMTLEDVDKMDEALKITFFDKRIRWHNLLEEWMLRLAHNEGCSHWGYKAPQDFMHLDLLEEIFPGISYIYIKRDPRKMMASLKYVRSQDGNPSQYHPVFYSIYWKKASQIMLKHSHSYRVHQVKFELLVKSPQSEAEKIAGFLGSKLSKELIVKQANTSFSKSKRKNLTMTEKWLCEKIINSTLEDNGYESGQGKFKLSDVFDLIITSVRFSFYQLNRIRRRKSSLVSIKSFLCTITPFVRKN